MPNRWGNSGNSGTFYFLRLQYYCRWWLQHEIKSRLLLGRKAVTNLESILKNRHITLLTNVCIVKAMVFLAVIYGFESWVIKKTEHWRIDAFEVWCWRRLLRVPWTTGRSNQLILKDIKSEYSLEGLFTEAPILWPPDARSPLTGKDPDARERLRAGEGDDRGWDG